MALACPVLDSEHNFIDFINDLRDITHDDLTVAAMQPCRPAICSALYGVGNSDISGVGVVAGYIIHASLGVILASALLSRVSARGKGRLDNAIRKVYERYADAAVVLAVSVQIASVILLLQESYGVSTVNFGDLTIEITWAAALLTALPVVMTCLIPSDVSPRGGKSVCQTAQSKDRTLENQEMQLIWISVIWVLFFTTFVLRMVSSYSKGLVGESPGDVLLPQEANEIRQLCFDRESLISKSEYLVIDFFAIGGTLFVSIITIGILINGLVDDQDQLVVSVLAKRVKQVRTFLNKHPLSARWILVFCTFLWSVPQIRTIFRVREMQASLANLIGRQNGDSQWGYGQIMAVVVFLPVLLQALYELLARRVHGEDWVEH